MGELSSLVLVMIKLFAALGLGYFFQKRGIFDPNSNRRMSELIVTVTTPILIITSAAEKTDVPHKEMLILLLAGFMIYAFLTIAAFIIAHVVPISVEKRGVFICLLIFSNVSFMGYPVLEAFYGRGAILLASIVHMPFNILMFTSGINWLGREGEVHLTPFEKIKQAANPGLLASLISLLLVLSGIRIPETLLEPMRFIGDLTPALSMIILGSILGEFPIGDALRDHSIWVVCLMRLIVLPLIILYCSKPFFTSVEILGVIFITNMMPCGSMNAMVAAKYGGNDQYAAGGVLVTTVLSLVSIPLMIYLFL